MTPRLFFMLLLCGGVSLHGIAQTGIDTPYLFEKNHFSVSLVNGFNKSYFENTYGTDQPRSGIGNTHEFQLHYRFNIHKHWAIGLNAGFGFFGSNVILSAKDSFPGNENWGYFSRLSYRGFTQAKADLTYRFELNQRYLAFISSGFGARFFSESMYTEGWGGFNSSQQMLLYSYSSNKPKLFATAGFGVQRLLKSKNMLGVNLNYIYSLAPVYSGIFQVYDNTSGGIYANRGHAFTLGLEYVFTGAKKSMRQQFLTETSTLSRKEIRKKVKQEKRNLDENDMLIGYGTGLFFGRNKVLEKNTPFNSGSFASWIVWGSVEKEYKNNLFYVLDLSVQQFWSVVNYSPNSSGIGMGGGSPAFVSSRVSGGMGYRVILPKSNINLISFQAGAGVYMHYEQPGISGWGSGSLSLPGEADYFQYFEQDRIESNVMPVLYLGASRDFRLTSGLILSLAYRYDQGFITGQHTNIQYSQGTDPEVYHLNSVINGTSHTWQIGLKHVFKPKS